jgi:hypothetical protein
MLCPVVEFSQVTSLSVTAQETGGARLLCGLAVDGFQTISVFRVTRYVFVQRVIVDFSVNQYHPVDVFQASVLAVELIFTCA